MGKAVKTLQGIRAAALLSVLVIVATPVAGEENLITLPLNDAALVKARNVTVKAVRYRDSDALEVRQTGPYRGFDTDTFAFVPGLDFHDGTIEVDVAGSSLADAPANARGFIGVAFRIDEQGGTFGCEGLYIRPSNGRASDQLRRNRSTQYFSYPGYDFDRLRREAPGQYESYVDLEVGEWTHLRNRGRRGGRATVRRCGRAACIDRARPQTRSRCAWDCGAICRHRRGWPLSQPVDPPALTLACKCGLSTRFARPKFAIARRK